MIVFLGKKCWICLWPIKYKNLTQPRISIPYKVRNTYDWKYLTLNLTSMYLLTVYSGKQLHWSRVWGIIIACKWVFYVKLGCTVYLRLHKVKNVMSNSNSTFCTFRDRCQWPPTTYQQMLLLFFNSNNDVVFSTLPLLFICTTFPEWIDSEKFLSSTFYENFRLFSSAQIPTLDGWVGSANATTMLFCPPSNFCAIDLWANLFRIFKLFEIYFSVWRIKATSMRPALPRSTSSSRWPWIPPLELRQLSRRFWLLWQVRDDIL